MGVVIAIAHIAALSELVCVNRCCRIEPALAVFAVNELIAACTTPDSEDSGNAIQTPFFLAIYLDINRVYEMHEIVEGYRPGRHHPQTLCYRWHQVARP